MSKIDNVGACSPWRVPRRFGWSRRRVDGADVIYLVGELDLETAVQLRPRLMSVAEHGTTVTIVLDLSEVTFIDARCVGVIVEAWNAATRRGRRLRVDGLHGIPKRVFDVLGLESMLACATEPGDQARGARDRD